MSARLVAASLVVAALGVTGWAVARQAPPDDPPGRGRNPFVQQPQPDRGGGGDPFALRRATVPGRYTIITTGTNPLLLDTATGDTWLLIARKDEEPVWKPVRRDMPPPAKDAPPPPKDRRPQDKQ